MCAYIPNKWDKTYECTFNTFLPSTKHAFLNTSSLMWIVKDQVIKILTFHLNFDDDFDDF